MARRVLLPVLPLLVLLACSGKGEDPSFETGSAGTTSGGSSGARGGAGSDGAGTGGTAAGTGGTSGQSGSGGKAMGGKAGAGRGGSAGQSGNGAGGRSGGGGVSASGGTAGTTAGGGGGGSGSGGAGAGKAGTGADAGTGGGAGSSHTNPLSQDVIDAFVAAHNAARAKTDLNPPPNPALPPVTWDAILADSAYNYLAQCIASDGQLVDHNPNRQADYEALGGMGYVGENIYASTGKTVNPSDAVDSWMSEQKDYDYASNNISAAGHYTQVVWRDSVRIGCAIVNCPSVQFNNTILCDYAPGGNITSQKPY